MHMYTWSRICGDDPFSISTAIFVFLPVWNSREPISFAPLFSACLSISYIVGWSAILDLFGREWRAHCAFSLCRHGINPFPSNASLANKSWQRHQTLCQVHQFMKTCAKMMTLSMFDIEIVSSRQQWYPSGTSPRCLCFPSSRARMFFRAFFTCPVVCEPCGKPFRNTFASCRHDRHNAHVSVKMPLERKTPPNRMH